MAISLHMKKEHESQNMKRIDLIRHLEAHGCEFFREGSKHTVYLNRAARTSSTIPRHREISEFLARKICRDLQVPELGQKK
jgi:mRNA interferase HicA